MRAAALALVVAVGCGGRELTVPSGPYPPNDVGRLARMFDPELRPLGLRLVRATLIDRTEGRYEKSDTGTHLALYAEPFEWTSADRAISNIVPLTRVFVPSVFEQWGGLKSFDICQEPSPASNDDPEPPPVTQVTVYRGPVSDLDWSGMDLPDLIRASRTYPQELGVILSPVLRRSPRLQPLLEPSPTP